MNLDPTTQADYTGPAWYASSRSSFIDESIVRVANHLAARAAKDGMDTGPEQLEEWHHSVGILQPPLRGAADRQELSERVGLVRAAVAGFTEIRDVILEYDFRRRGLRIDCVLLADGVLFVLEFKRSRATAADRDQVMRYAFNLHEFHRVTRELADAGSLIVPVIVLTEGSAPTPVSIPPPSGPPLSAISSRPMVCAGAAGLGSVLRLVLCARQSRENRSRSEWLNSPFSPSSTIIDAALSLYGQHDVSAIESHAAPKETIDRSTAEIDAVISATLKAREHRVVFLSGSPGSGKTLVGLNLAFSRRHGPMSVFVTGNSPLVEVLQAALQSSYRTVGRGRARSFTAGYPKSGFQPLVSASTYKIVKAHQFLGQRGRAHGQEDGRVVIFDEAQRTYEKGRQVLRTALRDHEADLVLKAQRSQFPDGAVVVALIGHNQAINRGERGMRAWFEAAEREGWRVSAGDDTLGLLPAEDQDRWRHHPSRTTLEHGHLRQSMRFYRNDAMERWVDAVLDGTSEDALRIADRLRAEGSPIHITRDLEAARRWGRSRAVGGDRCGLVASGQARRLAACGLFVDLKPNIADWMLAATEDHRSSNSLETVQNQFQVQGLEIDFAIVCWDLDLRRNGREWSAHRMSGADWARDSAEDVARNTYRVLLTRARKGLTIFVPTGDTTNVDVTRPSALYDAIAEYLGRCGATPPGT